MASKPPGRHDQRDVCALERGAPAEADTLRDLLYPWALVVVTQTRSKPVRQFASIDTLLRFRLPWRLCVFAISPRKFSRARLRRRNTAIRMLFDGLVTGQIVPFNPAASVRSPTYLIRKGKGRRRSVDQTGVKNPSDCFLEHSYKKVAWASAQAYGLDI